MLRNFKILIEYDGTAYHGWQRQKNDRTIQQEIDGIQDKIAELQSEPSGSVDAQIRMHDEEKNRLETLEEKLSQLNDAALESAQQRIAALKPAQEAL